MSFFIAAYVALWIGIFAYLLGLAVRLRSLRNEVRSLAEAARAERLSDLESTRPEVELDRPSAAPRASPTHPLEPPARL